MNSHSHQTVRAETSRRDFLARSAAAFSGTLLCGGIGRAGEPLGYRIELTTAREGFDRKTGKACWAQSRAGIIPPGVPGNPGDRPLCLITTQPLLLSGSDVYTCVHEMRSDDLGRTWTPPKRCPTLARRIVSDDVEVALCDFTPTWHAATGRLLGTGQTAWYLNNRLMPNRTRETGYSVRDPQTGEWSPWKTLELPDVPRFKSAGAGCTQRVDLANGEILLPVYFKPVKDRCYSATVLRCRFDGQELLYVEHGDELKHDVPRGFCEPSLTRFDDRFFLTIRNDVTGHVTSGPDGLHFEKPRPWTFDDGTDLGSYNTQQHWVTHSDGLYLVYTRRDVRYDHIFRHRAPLWIARVDPQRLCVIRSTERVIVPQRGTRLGNFGVAQVGPTETWVVTTEWMQPAGVERYGSANRIYVAKIHWNRPNRPA